MLVPVTDRLSPMSALAVAVVAVSTSAILVRASHAPPVVEAFYRVLFMTATVAPFVRPHTPAIRGLSRRDHLVVVASGVALALHFLAWFTSIELTSIAASTVLVQTQPVFVAFGAWLLLDEPPNRYVTAGIVVALAGATLMPLSSLLGADLVGVDPLVGDALAVVGALAGASYVLAGRSTRQRLALVPYTTLVYGVCTLTLLVVVLATGHPLFAYGPREWALFLAMALVPGFFGHTVINWVLAHVESSVVSVALLGEPVGSAILALLVFTEYPGPATILGGLVVLAGIYVTTRGRETA